VDPRPGRGTFAVVRPAADEDIPAPDLSWQALALGDRMADSDALHRHLALPPSDAIGLSAGYPDESLQPTTILAQAMGRGARRPGAWAKVPTEGVDRLRRWFALGAGGHVRPHDVIVTPGAQAGLATCLRVLAAPGSSVLLESPTYLGAIGAARAAGLRVVPVPVDTDGVRPDVLAEAFARTKARVFVCQPLFANPTGATLAADRRAAVLDAVRAADAFLIEDDYARDLALDGDPPPPLVGADPDGHVIYLRSLTKSTAPSLRVGAIAARGAAGARLRAARVLDDFFVGGPLQEAALDVVSSPAFRRHRRRFRATLRDRRDRLAAAVRRHLPGARFQVPAGGLNLWVALPGDLDDVALAAEAARVGVVVSAGRPWFPAEPPGPYLRLSFAGAPAADLERGVQTLGAIAARRSG
jgi:DNA-binding transcriptional MocR family regulator